MLHNARKRCSSSCKSVRACSYSLHGTTSYNHRMPRLFVSRDCFVAYLAGILWSPWSRVRFDVRRTCEDDETYVQQCMHFPRFIFGKVDRDLKPLSPRFTAMLLIPSLHNALTCPSSV